MPQLYYDTFANEVVTDTDEIAPPERYIRVHCSHVDNGVFIEKWSIGNGKFLDIAYTRSDRGLGMENEIRRCVAKIHNANLQYITDWTVPLEHYKKMKEAENE